MIAITPDDRILGWIGPLPVSATLAFTWLVMALMTAGSWLITRRLSTGPTMTRWQNLVEVLVGGIEDQIRAVARQAPGPYLPFIGTMFLFIATSNLLAVVPGYQAPTGSLSTTAALAICVFVAVPVFGIAQQGPLRFLRQYVQPSPLMLPFNLIGEFSRTLFVGLAMIESTAIYCFVLSMILVFANPFWNQVLTRAAG